MPRHPLRTAPRLEVRDLSVIRGERLVLDAVSFVLDDGEAILLTGPNGAGKSTLLRTVAGLRRPDAGDILWHGDETGEGDTIAPHVAYLGHQDALKPGLTLAENLHLTACLNGTSIEAALEEVDLLSLADLPARLLSAGQKRRGAIARILLTAAPLWLLDEPSLGLDAEAVERFGTVLARHRAAGGMMIVTTHVPLPMPETRKLVLPAAHREFFP